MQRFARVALWAAIALTAATAVDLALTDQRPDALAVAALLGAAVAVVVWRRVPRHARIVFVAVAALDAQAYRIDLFDRPYTDSAAHIVTTLAATLVIASLRHRVLVDLRRSAIRLVGLCLAVGLGIGLLWEALEWAAIMGPTDDVLADLAMDGIGALGAAALLLVRRCRPPRDPRVAACR